MRTVTVTVRGEEDARNLIAGELVGRWFQCDPLPDDWWEFTVKPEALPAVRAQLAHQQAIYKEQAAVRDSLTPTVRNSRRDKLKRTTMTTRKNAGQPGDLHEIIADIAYTAGIARHYSGDSRADMQSYISWAREFAASFTQEQEDAGEYMELIEAFADMKLKEAGNCDEPTAPHPGAARMDEGRDHYSGKPAGPTKPAPLYIQEDCDECNGTRYPEERHEEHCSLYKATEKGGTE